MKKTSRPKHPVSLSDVAKSIDDLASMTANGFREVTKRVDSLEERLDGRIDGVEQKLGAIHGEILSMHYDHKTLKARMENVELKVFGSIQEA